MGKETGISWTNHTFNPVWGCTKVSPGCKNCYAETFSKRYKWDVWGPGKERRRFEKKHWNEPLNWNTEARKLNPYHRETVFCGSMCDWCDVEWPVEVLAQMWWTIQATRSNLLWLLLTKRPERIPECLPRKEWADNLPYEFVKGLTPDQRKIIDWKNWHQNRNVVLGTSIELDEYVWRADRLRDIPHVLRFISAEPLLGPLPSLNLKKIDWLIVGGESGSGWRKMEQDWATDLQDRCEKEDVTFFYKQDNGQFSGTNPYLQGKEYKAWPEKFRLPLVAAVAK